MSTRRILLAVADLDERVVLAGHLAGSGFEVTAMDGTTAGLPMSSEALAEFDALVLDAGPGGLNGAALCAAMRRGGVALPILVLHGGGEDVVHCLNAGANDGLARPVRALELAARLRAQLRQHGAQPGAVLDVGPYLFRTDRRELEAGAGGLCIRLTVIEAAILRFLHAANGRPVPRRVLLHEVWGYRAGVTTHTVETHIYRLRRKIEPEPGRRRLLLSEDAGYRLNQGWHAPVAGRAAAELRASAELRAPAELRASA